MLDEIFFFTEQAIFFRKTRFLMLVHGSTLANMVYMNENSIVLELAKKTCKTTFVVLSQVIGIRLYELMFTNQTYFFYNQWVDIPVLVNAVKKIMSILDSEANKLQMTGKNFT